MIYRGIGYDDQSDFAQFVKNTVAFVDKCVPEASIKKRAKATAAIVKQFEYLFNDYGARIR